MQPVPGDVEDFGGFLLEAMPMMFIPAAVFAVMSANAGGKAKTLLANNITRDIFSEVFDECIYAAGYRLPDELLREAALISNWDRASGSDLVRKI